MSLNDEQSAHPVAPNPDPASSLPPGQEEGGLRKQLVESNGVLKVLYNHSDLPSNQKETIGEVIDRNTDALAFLPKAPVRQEEGERFWTCKDGVVYFASHIGWPMQHMQHAREVVDLHNASLRDKTEQEQWRKVVEDVRQAIASFVPADENIEERTTLDALNVLFRRIARGHWPSEQTLGEPEQQDRLAAETEAASANTRVLQKALEELYATWDRIPFNRGPRTAFLVSRANWHHLTRLVVALNKLFACLEKRNLSEHAPESESGSGLPSAKDSYSPGSGLPKAEEG